MQATEGPFYKVHPAVLVGTIVILLIGIFVISPFIWGIGIDTLYSTLSWAREGFATMFANLHLY